MAEKPKIDFMRLIVQECIGAFIVSSTLSFATLNERKMTITILGVELEVTCYLTEVSLMDKGKPVATLTINDLLVGATKLYGMSHEDIREKARIAAVEAGVPDLDLPV